MCPFPLKGNRCVGRRHAECGGVNVALELKSRSAAVVLANDIEQRIRASNLLPGEIFASEQDLQSGAEAGRSVVRQAVRLLEQRGAAYMKRGVGGGLVVQAPDLGAAARRLSLVIERDIEGFSDLESLNRATDAFLMLDMVRNLDLDQVDRLRGLAQSLEALSSEAFVEVHGHRQMVIALSEALGDPAANLFRRTSMECGLDLVPWELNERAETLRGEFWSLTLARLEALIAGDVPKLFAIREAQAQYYLSSPQWRAMDARRREPVGVEAGPRSELKAERLSREILREVRSRGWVIGDRLGSFEELGARFGATAPVLREAIRMLEEHSAVHMQRGRSGGLIISAPDRARAVAGALHYLRAVKAVKQSIVSHLDQIMMEAIERAVEHASASSIDRWAADALSPVRESGSFYGGLARIYISLANLSDNTALSIVVEVLANYVWPSNEPGVDIHSPDLAELDVLARCLAARDAPKARRSYIVHRSRLQEIYSHHVLTVMKSPVQLEQNR